MYSFVLVMALSNGAQVPATADPEQMRTPIHQELNRHRGRCGCCGGGYSGCYGGCWGGYSSYGSCGGGYGGGMSYSGYGCSGGGMAYGGCSGYGGMSSGGYGTYGGMSYGCSGYGGMSYGSMGWNGSSSMGMSGAPYYGGTMQGDTNYGRSTQPGLGITGGDSGRTGSGGTNQPRGNNQGRSGGQGANPGGSNPDEPVAAPATIYISLPADATLTVDDQATTSTSAERTFVTPQLKGGHTYHYTFKATVMRDGQPVERTREIAVRAGQPTNVSFDFTTAAVAQK